MPSLPEIVARMPLPSTLEAVTVAPATGSFAEFVTMPTIAPVDSFGFATAGAPSAIAADEAIASKVIIIWSARALSASVRTVLSDPIVPLRAKTVQGYGVHGAVRRQNCVRIYAHVRICRCATATRSVGIIPRYGSLTRTLQQAVLSAVATQSAARHCRKTERPAGVMLTSCSRVRAVGHHSRRKRLRQRKLAKARV